MSEQQTRWVIVEIMGHRVVAGRLSFGDAPYDRGVAVDVPLRAQEGQPETFAQEFYGAGALFSVRIVPEDVARRAAEGSYHVRDLSRALNPPPALPPATAPEAPLSAVLDEIANLYAEDDDFDVGMGADHWETKLRECMEAIEDIEDEPSSETVREHAHRKLMLRLATTAVSAILDHDSDDDEDEEALF